MIKTQFKSSLLSLQHTDRPGLQGLDGSSRFWKPQPAFLSRPAPSQTSPTHPELAFLRREQTELSQAAQLDQESYEDSHLGGYRRIYPGPDTEKYAPFFKHSGSLFQETVASKAREECARYSALHAPLHAGGRGATPAAGLLPPPQGGEDAGPWRKGGGL